MQEEVDEERRKKCNKKGVKGSRMMEEVDEGVKMVWKGDERMTGNGGDG